MFRAEIILIKIENLINNDNPRKFSIPYLMDPDNHISTSYTLVIKTFILFDIKILPLAHLGTLSLFNSKKCELIPQSLGFAFTGLSNQEIFVDVGNNTSASNGGFNEQVELFVSSDGQLQMSGGDSSDFEVL